MSSVIIDIKSKRYPNRITSSSAAVIEDLKLEIPKGEFVCVVGPSGCGKTTLLNILAGLDEVFDGSIEHRPSSETPPRISYVFQNPRLLPWRTVEENIQLSLPENFDTDYIDHLFERVGLKESIHVYPQRLSLGMSRRASLVRAFGVNPDLLLMDEPFVSLDPPTARRIRKLVLDLWTERPHTVLFVTHDLREAIELGDRLIFLSSSPAQIVYDLTIELPRDERGDDTIAQYIERIRSNIPGIAELL